MRIYILENIGEIKVKYNKKPLSKVYVKCFARKTSSSTPVFYKDGYTDIRGTFDYASLLIEKQTDYHEFALMIYSEEHGGLIQVVKSPKTMMRTEKQREGKLLSLFGGSWANMQKTEFKTKAKKMFAMKKKM